VPKFLIVAATKPEVRPILTQFNIAVNSDEGLFKSHSSQIDVSVLITGIGMVNTAFYLGKYVNEEFTNIINLGICGAFNRNIKIGEVINVHSDIISEMGAENDKDFIKISDLNLGTNVFYSSDFNLAVLDDPIAIGLKKVKGITVNKVHGNDESIAKVISLYAPDVESMEGAAFFRACKDFNGKFIQLRAVSNYVEKRDKSKWNIPLAIENVNEFVIKLIDQFKTSQL